VGILIATKFFIKGKRSNLDTTDAAFQTFKALVTSQINDIIIYISKNITEEKV